MLWKRLFLSMMLDLLSKQVPVTLRFAPIAPITLSKRTWDIVLDLKTGFQISWKGNSVERSFLPSRHRPVARSLHFEDGDSDTVIISATHSTVFTASPSSPVAKKTRRKKPLTSVVETAVRR